MAGAIDRHPDLKARMERELMIARNTGCRECDLDGIRRKFNDIAQAREDGERLLGIRRIPDRP